MDSKFNSRINELYNKFLLEAPLDVATEPESEEEQKVTVSEPEIAQARGYVNRKKIFGLNIGKSKEVKNELERKKELDDQYDDEIMPDVLDRMKVANDTLQKDIDSVKKLGY